MKQIILLLITVDTLIWRPNINFLRARLNNLQLILNVNLIEKDLQLGCIVLVGDPLQVGGLCRLVELSATQLLDVTVEEVIQVVIAVFVQIIALIVDFAILVLHLVQLTDCLQVSLELISLELGSTMLLEKDVRVI